MKLIYVATRRIPSGRAHSIQISNMCEAFVRAGFDVELVAPRRRGLSYKNASFAPVGVKPLFKLVYLPAIDLTWTGLPFADEVLAWTFLLSLRLYLLSKAGAVLYVRSELLLPLIGMLDQAFPIFWETHQKPTPASPFQRVLERLSGIVATTRFYATELVNEWKAPSHRVLAASNAVDFEAFERSESRPVVRQRLGIEPESRVVMYVGLLDRWKGVETLCEAARLLAPEVTTLVVGGFSNEPSARNADAPVRYLGVRPYIDLPHIQKAADVLVLPNSEVDVRNLYTSPLKLFSYMCSGVPIVASDIPALREIISEDDAYFVPAGDPAALATAVKHILANPDEARIRAARALEKARRHTWDARAAAIAEFIRSRRATRVADGAPAAMLHPSEAGCLNGDEHSGHR